MLSLRNYGSADNTDLALLGSGTVRYVHMALEDLCTGFVLIDDTWSTGFNNIPVNWVKWLPGLSCNPVNVYM